MQDKRTLALLLLVGLLSPACKKDSSESEMPRTPPPPAAPPPVVAEPPKEKPVYVYSGDRFRDPFMSAGQSANYQPDALFDPQRATVKGIIFGKDYKSAVLMVGGNGSYFVKAGKVFDIMGKQVEGYSAKIFIDKVVLLGEADNVFELKLKGTEEEAKPL